VKSGVGPAWGLLISGALAQTTFELLSPEAPLVRAAAVGLIAVVLLINGVDVRRRRLRGVGAAMVLLAASPLWFGHTQSVLKAVGPQSVVLAALGPALLVFGSVFHQLLHIDARSQPH
jgi:hypothetical protein